MLRANHLVNRHEQGVRPWDSRAERQWTAEIGQNRGRTEIGCLSVTPTQHPWRLRSREGHGSRIAGSGFVHSYCMMLLASFVALRLGNADFAQFMDFPRWPWRPSIEPREP